jgi:hypothetical protein
VTLHNYNIIKIPVGPAPNTPLKLLFILQKYTVKFVNCTAVFINWQYRHISKQFTRLSYKNSNRKTRLFYLDSVDFKDNFGRLFSSVLQQKHGGSKLMLSKIIWTRFREFSHDLFHESFRVFTLTDSELSVHLEYDLQWILRLFQIIAFQVQPVLLQGET